MGAQRGNSAPDALVARIAANQHGLISAAQLQASGIHRRGRERRIGSGHLHVVHRGVYAVGHRGLSREGTWMAAVLAGGPGAVLSHLSAGHLWGMLRVRPPSSPAAVDVPSHVTVPGNARRRRGIVIHRSRTLDAYQITRRLNIPVTSPSRTLRDLRRLLPSPQFREAIRQAEFLGLQVEPDLEPDQTRSELEAKFLALCRRHRLPKPVVNARVGPFVVDFLWPERALIAEVDGYGAHGGREAFEADRARDVELKLLGLEVVRLTWRQITDDPSALATSLRALLAARGHHRTGPLRR